MTASFGSRGFIVSMRDVYKRQIDYFGVGNENWGCGGNMRPQHYADRPGYDAGHVGALFVFQNNHGIVAVSYTHLDVYKRQCFSSHSVSLPRFDNPQEVSDKLQTMSELPSVPSGTAS